MCLHLMNHSYNEINMNDEIILGWSGTHCPVHETSYNIILLDPANYLLPLKSSMSVITKYNEFDSWGFYYFYY